MQTFTNSLPYYRHRVPLGTVHLQVLFHLKITMINNKDTNNSISLLRAKYWTKNFTCITSHHVQNIENTIISLCCCSVTQSCPILCNLCTPGFPVLHHISKPAQTHAHWVGDAVQPSHPLLPPSPPALSFPASGSFPMSRLFPSGGQSIAASASVLPVNSQDWLPLGLTGLISFLYYFTW